MKSILFICNTHFQLLIAINMKLTDYQNDEVDIIISDHMNDSYSLYQRVKSQNVFRDVYYIESKSIMKKEFSNKFKEAISYIFLGRLDKYFRFNGSYYDELFLYNIDLFSEFVTFKVQKINRKVKLNLFDEGVSTYSKLYEHFLYGEYNLNKMKNLIHKFIGREYISHKASYLYLLDPDLTSWKFKGELKEIKKPNLEANGFRTLINSVFSVDGVAEYSSAFIFFEESFFADGKSINDLLLIEHCISSLDNNNFMVKVHPRNKENRFEKLNIITNHNTAMPWEAIVLNLPVNRRKYFITISSTAVLSPYLFFNRQFPVVLLYNLVEQDEINKEYIEFFQKFNDKYNEFLYAPESLEELRYILKNFVEKDGIRQ